MTFLRLNIQQCMPDLGHQNDLNTPEAHIQSKVNLNLGK